MQHYEYLKSAYLPIQVKVGSKLTKTSGIAIQARQRVPRKKSRIGEKNLRHGAADMLGWLRSAVVAASQ